MTVAPIETAEAAAWPTGGQLNGQPGQGLIEWAFKADAAGKIARWLVGTSFVPETLRVRDETTAQLKVEATVMQVVGALMKGDSLGFDPTASLEVVMIIPPGSGRPALAAVALGALLHRHHHHYWTVERTQTRCTLRGRAADALPDQPDEEVTWDTDRAKALVGNAKFTDPRGNWKRQQGTMLYWRALAELARIIAPEVMLGLPVLDVEADDLADDDTAPGAEGTPARKRSTGKRQGSSPRARAARAPSPPGPPEPEADPRHQSRAEAAPSEPMITVDQRTALHAGLNELGIKGRDGKARVVSGWIGREITSSNELTQAEASTALDKIREARDRLATEHAQQQAAEGPQEPERQDDPGPDEPAPDE